MIPHTNRTAWLLNDTYRLQFVLLLILCGVVWVGNLWTAYLHHDFLVGRLHQGVGSCSMNLLLQPTGLESNNPQWTPLTNISYCLHAGLHAPVMAVRAMTVAQHLINVLLLFGVLFMTLNSRPAAVFVGSLFFAIHPVVANGLNVLINRSELLLTSWFLAGAFLIAIYVYRRQHPLIVASLPLILGAAMVSHPAGEGVVPLWCLLWFVMAYRTRALTHVQRSSVAAGMRWLNNWLRSHWILLFALFGVWLSLYYAKNIVLGWQGQIPTGHWFEYTGLTLAKLFWPFSLDGLYTAELWHQPLIVVKHRLLITMGVAIVVLSFACIERRWRGILMYGVMVWAAWMLSRGMTTELPFRIGALMVPLAILTLFGALLLVDPLPRVVSPSIIRVTRLALGSWLVILTIVCTQNAARWQDRFEYWFRSYQATPHSQRANLELARIYRTRDQFDTAADFYRAHIRLARAQTAVHTELAEMLYSMERYDEAITAIEAAILFDPNSPQNYNLLGSLFVDRGEYVRALHSFRRLVELDAENIQYKNNLAALLFQLGHFEESGRYFAQVVQAQPDSELAHIAYLMVLQKLENDEALLSQIQRVNGLSAQWSVQSRHYLLRSLVVHFGCEQRGALPPLPQTEPVVGWWQRQCKRTLL